MYRSIQYLHNYQSTQGFASEILLWLSTTEKQIYCNMQMSLSPMFQNEEERRTDLQLDFMLPKTSMIGFWENLPQLVGVCG